MGGEPVETEQRIDELEDRMDRVEDQLDNHGDRLDKHDRNYSELRRQNEKMAEKQVRLEAFMESGFKRGEDQNNQILTGIAWLRQRQDDADQRNQERHEQIIQMVNQGDRENFEAMSNRKWDAKTVWITVAACLVIGVPSIVELWRLVFG